MTLVDITRIFITDTQAIDISFVVRETEERPFLVQCYESVDPTLFTSVQIFSRPWSV